MVKKRNKGQNEATVADDDDVENGTEANELHAANGQSSSDSFSHSQLDQTDDELQQLLSLQQLGLDEIQCSLQFANNCIETGEAVELCQEFFEEAQQKIVDFESLTKQIILHSKSHLNRQSTQLSGVKNDLRSLRLKIMKKRASDQLSHPSEVYPVTRTNPQQVFGNLPSDELQGTSNNPLPAFTIPDSSLQSTAPAVTSNFPGINDTSSQLETAANPLHVAPRIHTEAPVPNNVLQGVGASPRMSSTFQKSIPKVKPTTFNGDPLLWLDWIGLFNATIHSSDMTTAEKMTHLQTLVKDQAKSVIRGYGYNGDMYFTALKRLQDSFGNPTKIVTSFLQRLNCHPIPTLEQPDSFTVYSNFLTTLVDTFEQLNFQHDIRSTTNVQQALRKLPTETRLAWNRHAVSSGLKQPTLNDVTLWLREFALACSEMPVPQQTTSIKNGQPQFSHDSRSSSGTANHHKSSTNTPRSGPTTDALKKDFCPESKGCPLLRQCPHFKSLDLQSRYDHVKKLKLCFNCLGPHAFKDCKSETTCRTDGCQRRHHTLLHRDQHPAVSSAVNTRRHLPGIVPILPVTLSYGNNQISTYALLDSGSSVTLLAESAAKLLQPDLERNQQLSVTGINTVAEVDVATIQCFIGPYNSPVQPHRLDKVFSVPTLNVQTAQPAFLNSVCQQHPHLNHVKFPQLSSNSVSLLIGVDSYDVICSRGVIHGPPNTPKSLHTLLGWTIVGNSSHQLPTTAQTLLVRTPTMDDELFQQVHRWMRQDIEGVSSAKKAFSSNDRRAEKILQSTTTKVEGRYQIGLLWKENVDLPNNRWVAERQLSGLEQRLEKDSNLKQLYQKTIDDDLAKGYIVRVPPNDTTVKKWYLPHHPVTNIHKPGKVRRVTNASSVFKGKSLNSSLLTGPDFLCNLTGLILRFRLHRVAISADIEAMFMQVLVDRKDRPFLRFLWRNNNVRLRIH